MNFRNLAPRRPGLKFLALLVAVLLWFLSAGQDSQEMGQIVPVELVNIPPTTAVEGNSLEFVHVRLRGPAQAMQQIDPQTVRISLDLSGIKPGDNVLPVTGRELRLPRGVELVNVSPPYLLVKAAARKELPVRVLLRGKPAEGYRVTRILPSPPALAVIGPPAKLKALKEITTYPVSVRGVSETFSSRVDLNAPEPEIRIIELEPTRVTVTVEGNSREKTFSRIPLEVVGKAKAKAEPATVAVTVSGYSVIIDALAPGEVKARVELGPLYGTRFNRKVSVSVPAGVSVLGVDPGSVTVILEEDE